LKPITACVLNKWESSRVILNTGVICKAKGKTLLGPLSAIS